MDSLKKELDVYKSKSVNEIQKKINAMNVKAKSEANTLKLNNEHLKEMLAFKDTKLAELKKEIKRIQSACALDKINNKHRRAGSVEYKISINPKLTVDKEDKSLNKLLNAPNLLNLLTAQAKIVERKLGHNKDYNIEEWSEQKEELDLGIKKIFKGEKRLNAVYKKLLELARTTTDSDQVKDYSIEIVIESLINEGDIIEAADLIIVNNYTISESTTKRLIKELIKLCKSNHNNAISSKGEQYANIEKVKGDKELIVFHKEMQKMSERMYEIDEVIEDLNSEHCTAIAKLEHILGLNIPPKELSNDQYIKALEMARTINGLIREVWIRHGKVEVNQGELCRVLKETCIPANETYKEFFAENKIRPITVESLLERIKVKNMKFKSLFKLYEKLLDINSSLLFSKGSTMSPISKQNNDPIFHQIELAKRRRVNYNYKSASASASAFNLSPYKDSLEHKVESLESKINRKDNVEQKSVNNFDLALKEQTNMENCKAYGKICRHHSQLYDVNGNISNRKGREE